MTAKRKAVKRKTAKRKGTRKKSAPAPKGAYEFIIPRGATSIDLTAIPAGVTVRFRIIPE